MNIVKHHENKTYLSIYHINIFRSRNFIPHYVWRKTSRPSGVGLSPWDSHLYVCGMDSHSVMVVERAQAKIVTRLTCDEMLCPVQIAFMKSQGEIYVTGKSEITFSDLKPRQDYVKFSLAIFFISRQMETLHPCFLQRRSVLKVHRS